MTKKTVFVFIASYLIFLIPAPSRFGCGIVLILCADAIALSLIPLQAVIGRLRIGNYKNIVTMLAALCITLILYALLTLWSPITAFTLGFIVYIIPASLFMSGADYPKGRQEPFGDSLKKGAKNCAVLSTSALLFFALRELAAYGTLSFPCRSGLYIVEIFTVFSVFPVYFWSTIPGALVLFAVQILILSALYHRYILIQEEEKQ